MSESVRIDALAPKAAVSLDDDAIAAHYSVGESDRWLRANFVSSVDGAATHDGLSGGLGDAADRRVFDILRRLCDVVLVGAGTVRAEGYGAMRVDDSASAWRVAHGLAALPTLAIVSASLRLDPSSRVFTEAPTRPIIVTVEGSTAHLRAEFATVADVVIAGKTTLDPATALGQLADRGLRRVLCEGGPRLFGTLTAAGVVDELCLTLSPRLELGTAQRITHGWVAEAQGLRLGAVLASGDTLLMRYLIDS